MINLKEIFKNIRKKRSNLASEGELIESTSVSTFRKAQERRWLYVCLIIFGVFGVVMKLQGGNSNTIKNEENVYNKLLSTLSMNNKFGAVKLTCTRNKDFVNEAMRLIRALILLKPVFMVNFGVLKSPLLV